jgi:hypothetical protein
VPITHQNSPWSADEIAARATPLVASQGADVVFAFAFRRALSFVNLLANILAVGK